MTGIADLAAFCAKYAVTEPNVVTAEIATIADLADLLTDQLRKVHSLAPDRPKGRQELVCAADVAEALAEVAREPERTAPDPDPFMQAGAVGNLINIPVITGPESAPGTWRLVTHGGCKVIGEYPDHRISHEECEITAEGCLA